MLLPQLRILSIQPNIFVAFTEYGLQNCFCEIHTHKKQFLPRDALYRAFIFAIAQLSCYSAQYNDAWGEMQL